MTRSIDRPFTHAVAHSNRPLQTRVAQAQPRISPGKGSSGLQSSADLIQEAERLIVDANRIMDLTLGDYADYLGGTPPGNRAVVQGEAEGNLRQQNLLKTEAEKIKAEIAKLEKNETADSMELDDLRQELRKLEDITRVQFANELLLDAKGQTDPIQHALMMDDLRNRLDHFFLVSTGHSEGTAAKKIMSARKLTLLRAAEQAVAAWEKALAAQMSGNNVEICQKKLDAAKAVDKKIKDPNYTGGCC